MNLNGETSPTGEITGFGLECWISRPAPARHISSHLMGWMNSRFSLEDLGRIRGELYKHEYQSDHGIFQDMGLIWDVPSGQLTVVAIVIHQLIGRISHSGLKDIQAVTR